MSPPARPEPRPPGAHVSARWAAWRAGTDLQEYETRWNRLEADGGTPHGEADLVSRHSPHRVLDAGCGMGRVAIELDRRGIEVVGADLDGDLLAVARRHAPHLDWRLGDLARDQFGGEFDVIVMAGNVMIFCDPADRGLIVGNLAGQLAPGGRLIAGFALERTPGALSLRGYLEACDLAGLGVELVSAGWEAEADVLLTDVTTGRARAPRSDESSALDTADYAVVTARRPLA